eukprot:scaffold13910_cov96-Isochrysis_galbana.AAC.2
MGHRSGPAARPRAIWGGGRAGGCGGAGAMRARGAGERSGGGDGLTGGHGGWTVGADVFGGGGWRRRCTPPA